MYHCHCVSVSTLIYLSTIIVYAKCCAGLFGPKYGEMTPDPKLLNDSQLTLRCSLTNTTIKYEHRFYHINSSMIRFKFNKTYSPHKVTLINETVAELSVKRASINDNGIYYCMLNITGVDHSVVVCTSHVTVGYKPQPVSNFRCISVNLRKLICSWAPPLNPIATEYTLEDLYYYRSGDCGHYLAENRICEWTLETVPPYRTNARKFTFRLKGVNIFGEITQEFHINHYNIIKPGEPQGLKYTNVNATSLSLNWSPPDYIVHDEDLVAHLLYQIKIIKINLSSDQHSITRIYDGIVNMTQYVDHLIPYSHYNISVRCRTNVSDFHETYWGENASTMVITKSDVPYKSPVLSPESFETVKSGEGNRSITLYWKPILSEHRNGPKFYYIIEPTLIFRKIRSSEYIPSVNVMNADATSYTFTHMNSKAAYSFKIRGANDNGISHNYTTIYVENSDKMPYKPSQIDVYSFNNGSYKLNWKEPHGDARVSHYTVFWCDDRRSRPSQCEGTIEWKETTDNSIDLELSNDKNYQFAVSANVNGIASGMSWASCIAPSNGKLGKFVYFNVEEQTSTTIKVGWKLECPAQRNMVEKYKISYRELNSKCSAPKPPVIVNDKNAESCYITNLEPNCNYTINIVAFTKTGSNDESTNVIGNTTSDRPSDHPRNVSIKTTDNSITINWSPPENPNGVISKYQISDCLKVSKEVYIYEYLDVKNCNECSYELSDLKSDKSYILCVRACVSGKSESLCGPYSKAIVAKTNISNPGSIDRPRTEVQHNTSSIRVLWEPPDEANGPIDYYTLSYDYDNNTYTQNITNNSNDFYLKCGEESDPLLQYSFRVRAVNIRKGKHLLGPYSESTSESCRGILDKTGIFLMIAGITVGLFALIVVLYFLISWMKRKIEAANKLNIKLPGGLEGLNPWDLNDGDKPEKRLDRTDSIPNIPESNLDVDDAFKNRHGSGVSGGSTSSTEALMCRFGSGEQKGIAHGSSISSNSSNEAQVSCDSGTEVDTPNKMPLIGQETTIVGVKMKNKICVKVHLPIVAESRNSDSSGSRDSGLDMNSSGTERGIRKKKRNMKSEPLVAALPTTLEFGNPIYEHTLYAYNCLANSEPSLYDIPYRDDKNINVSRYCKPPLAKSFANIMQNNSSNIYSNYPKVKPTVGDMNISSRTTTSKNGTSIYQYTKYGGRRLIPLKDNHIRSTIQKQENQASYGYVPIGLCMKNPLPVNGKKLDRNHWSQKSYEEEEVSSNSSNGSPEENDEIFSPQFDRRFSTNSMDFERIRNDYLFNLNEPFAASALLKTLTPQESSVPCNGTATVASDDLRLPLQQSISSSSASSSLSSSPTNKCTKPKQFSVNHNGYVLHDMLNSDVLNVKKPNIAPKMVKDNNGYVSIPEIEMKHGKVPNVNHVNQITTV